MWGTQARIYSTACSSKRARGSGTGVKRHLSRRPLHTAVSAGAGHHGHQASNKQQAVLNTVTGNAGLAWPHLQDPFALQEGQLLLHHSSTELSVGIHVCNVRQQNQQQAALRSSRKGHAQANLLVLFDKVALVIILRLLQHGHCRGPLPESGHRVAGVQRDVRVPQEALL